MKDDLAYIEHILQAIDKILEFTKETNETDFEANIMLQDAVIRNIEVIGEATKRVSPVMRNKYPEIPWREMAGMRDKLIHDYLGVDTGIIWETIRQDIPRLKLLLKKIL